MIEINPKPFYAFLLKAGLLIIMNIPLYLMVVYFSLDANEKFQESLVKNEWILFTNIVVFICIAIFMFWRYRGIFLKKRDESNPKS